MIPTEQMELARAMCDTANGRGFFDKAMEGGYDMTAWITEAGKLIENLRLQGWSLVANS